MNNKIAELELLRNIVLGIPELVIVVSESGQYLELGGVSEHDPDDIIGKSLTDLFPESITNLFLGALDDAFTGRETGVKTIEYKLSPSADLKITLPGNEERWFELKINPLSITHHGERIAVCICRDITDLRSNEQKLIELSEQDQLTGVYNRNKLFGQLACSLNEHSRDATPACYLAFDLDNFKQINDKYGHLAGDNAICHLANICASEHRITDTFGRVGGDEFGLLLPNTTLSEACELAERIRTLVTEHVFIYGGERILLTVSIGISQIEKQDDDIESVIHRADQAMYRSKRQGKNLVTAHRAN